MPKPKYKFERNLDNLNLVNKEKQSKENEDDVVKQDIEGSIQSNQSEKINNTKNKNKTNLNEKEISSNINLNKIMFNGCLLDDNNLNNKKYPNLNLENVGDDELISLGYYFNDKNKIEKNEENLKTPNNNMNYF